MAYTLDWEDQGVCCAYEGVLTNDQLIEVDRQIISHPDFVSFRYGIADFTLVEQFDIGRVGVTETSHADKVVAPSNPNFRVAIVAPAMVMKGFARMWELTGGADVWETKIFDDIKSARQWIDD